MLGYLIGRAMADPVVVNSSLSTRERVDVSDFAQLRQRVDALELACAGLWSLLKSAHGFTDEQLREFIAAVDAADGSADGKLTRRQEVCRNCGQRVLARSAGKCLWCGALLVENALSPDGSGS